MSDDAFRQSWNRVIIGEPGPEILSECCSKPIRVGEEERDGEMIETAYCPCGELCCPDCGELVDLYDL